MYYEVAMNQVEDVLDDLNDKGEAVEKQRTEEAYKMMERGIKQPWTAQADRRRKHAPPHWNDKFIKLLARKKLLYDHMKWKKHTRNVKEYKEVCREAQSYERQLHRERQRRNIQKIQVNPKGEIALAIKKQADAKRRQVALDNFTGQQMAPRT